MGIYGTPAEQKELAMIQAEFPKACIYNPNRPYIQRHKNPMGACIDIVKDSSITALVFSAYKGEVTQGVYFEVAISKKLNKEIFVILGERIKIFVGKFVRKKTRKKSYWKVVNYAC